MTQKVIIIGHIGAGAEELIKKAIECNAFPIAPVITNSPFDNPPMPIVPLCRPIQFEDIRSGQQARRERRANKRKRK